MLSAALIVVTNHVAVKTPFLRVKRLGHQLGTWRPKAGLPVGGAVAVDTDAVGNDIRLSHCYPQGGPLLCDQSHSFVKQSHA